MPKEQENAVALYESPDYKAINAFNRGQNYYCKFGKTNELIRLTPFDLENLERVSFRISESIQNAPKFPFDITVYRVANLYKMNEKCEEEQISLDEFLYDPTFKSFSTDVDNSLSFCRSKLNKLNCILLQITIPAFQPVFFLSERENEVLFSKEATFLKDSGFTINDGLGNKIIVLKSQLKAKADISVQEKQEIIKKFQNFHKYYDFARKYISEENFLEFKTNFDLLKEIPAFDINAYDNFLIKYALDQPKRFFNIQYLIENGANAFSDSELLNTLLVFHRYNNTSQYINFLQFLIDKGFDVNKALHFIINEYSFTRYENTFNLIKLFIENGANIPDKLLEQAIDNNNPDLVKYLIDKGANIEYAKQYVLEHQNEMAELLKQFISQKRPRIE